MEERKKRRRLEKDAALEQMRSFCAYQERCHKEVRSRLLEYQVYGQDLEEVMSDLVTEGFLNEERFARSYARGKFRIKKWGRLKIKKELKLRQISEYCIRKGLSEIEEDEYIETIYNLLEKKVSTTSYADSYKQKKALTDYAVRKGYEYSYINEALADILKN